MLTTKPTGKTRFRIQKRLLREPLLVVQIELHTTGYEIDAYGGSMDVDYTHWRDMNVSDMPVPVAV